MKKVLSAFLIISACLLLSVSLAESAGNAPAGPAYRIELAETEISVYRGGYAAVSPQIFALQGGRAAGSVKYVWSSSDPSVAEVFNDRIIGKKAGNAVLTCSLKDDAAVSAALSVRVLNPVSRVTVPDTALVLFCNSTEKNSRQINAVCLPEGSSCDGLIYTSSNPQVIEVSGEGTVKALKPGSAVITVTAGLQGVMNPPRCMISVHAANKVDTISGMDPQYTLSVNRTLVISPRIAPESATNKKITWTTSDRSVATVSAGGVVRGIRGGTCTITAAAADGGGAAASCLVTVLQPVTGMRTLRDSGLPYSITAGTAFDTAQVFCVEPSDAAEKDFDITVYEDDGKRGRILPAGDYLLEGKVLTISRIGKYRITAASRENPRITASVTLYTRPENRNTLSMTDVWWEPKGIDSFRISFEISNHPYGEDVTSVQLYFYAVDAGGNDLFNGLKYSDTTRKNLSPGKKIRTDWIMVPDYSRISVLYCGIHKISFTDGTSITIDQVDYLPYQIR